VTDPVISWALGVFAGAVVGFWIGRWWPPLDPFNRWWRHSPYSTAAIALRDLAEKSPTVGRIIDPLVEGRVQLGNGNGGPATPKPGIIPRGTRSISFPDPVPDRQPTNPFTGDPVKPQPHGGRVIPGDTHG